MVILAMTKHTLALLGTVTGLASDQHHYILNEQDLVVGTIWVC